MLLNLCDGVLVATVHNNKKKKHQKGRLAMLLYDNSDFFLQCFIWVIYKVQINKQIKIKTDQVWFRKYIIMN